ncbi:unnamed protein product [Adineta steineri]|uniref:BED-type domain-containing protein n=1 Tax=Adineta steineri TaxID=433720 RepID=A0A819U517_9BILA|nr:unnamed protein product [Adineta steineri]
MSTSPIVVSENDVDDESSNVELNISSSSINTSSPKAGGYRKARCRYCTLSLSYAKIPLMYTHIANQCDAVVRINSAARLDTITKLSEFDQQSQSPKSVKRMIQLDDVSSTQKQKKIDQYGSRIIPTNERNEIDRSLLKALVMNGVTFNIITAVAAKLK